MLGTFDDFIGGNNFSSTRQQFLIGPTVGVRLPLNFSVEGDALYQRQKLSFGQFAGLSALSVNSDSWEFPMMLKYTAGGGFLAPVFGGGVSVRHINGFENLPSYVLRGQTDSNSVGFVAGAGLRIRTGPVNITPEVRYTRWNSRGLAQSIVDTFTGRQNQTQVLIGLTF